MNIHKIIAVIGTEIARDIRAKGDGEEAVKKRKEIKKQKNKDGLNICIGMIVAYIVIAIIISGI